MEKNKRRLGSEYEDIAVCFLEEKGYNIICRNFYCKFGEIDIIAENKGYIVFVEVKYRKNEKFGLPQEAVSFIKQKRIINSSKYYCMTKHVGLNRPIRYDIVAVLGENVEVIENAFEAF